MTTNDEKFDEWFGKQKGLIGVMNVWRQDWNTIFNNGIEKLLHDAYIEGELTAYDTNSIPNVAKEIIESITRKQERSKILKIIDEYKINMEATKLLEKPEIVGIVSLIVRTVKNELKLKIGDQE